MTHLERLDKLIEVFEGTSEWAEKGICWAYILLFGASINEALRCALLELAKKRADYTGGKSAFWFSPINRTEPRLEILREARQLLISQGKENFEE